MSAPITKPESTYQAVGTIRPENVAKKLEAIRNHEYRNAVVSSIHVNAAGRAREVLC